MQSLRTLIETPSTLTTAQKVKSFVGELRRRMAATLGNDEDPLTAYRQLALQLVRHDGERGSVLLATPASSELVAECCASLGMSLAALLRKPILLVDVSDEGRRLPSLVGLTSEMYCSTDERSRFFSISGRWYVSTREGIPLGPYRSIVEAEGGLCDFIHAPSSEKAALEKACPPYVTLPTSVQNLFFFPAGPARQAVVRGIYLGAEAEHVAGLIDELHSLFAYIIFYAGAVSSNPLMLPVLSRVSEVIHAVIENDTKVADIQAAQKILQNHRADPVPFVLIRPRRSGRFEPSS